VKRLANTAECGRVAKKKWTGGAGQEPRQRTGEKGEKNRGEGGTETGELGGRKEGQGRWNRVRALRK